MIKIMISDGQAAFITTGAGLRGVPVMIMDRDDGSLLWARVYRNDATHLYLDIELTRYPDQYDSYLLGSIPTVIESGDLTFGNPRVVKTLRYFNIYYERNFKGQLVLDLAADQLDQEDTEWTREGYIPLTGTGYYRMPIDSAAGTGRTIRYQLKSTDPGWEMAITHISIDFETRGDWE